MFCDTFDNILISISLEVLSWLWTEIYSAMVGQDRTMKSVISCQVCQSNKCKDEKGLRKASVLGTVFPCSTLWYIEVCYDMFHGQIWPSHAHSLSLRKFCMYFISCPILPMNFDEIPFTCFSIRFQYAFSIARII